MIRVGKKSEEKKHFDSLMEPLLHLLRRLSETPGGIPAVVATHLLGVALSELLGARALRELLGARVLLQSRLHHRFPAPGQEHPMIELKAISLDKPISTKPEELQIK